MQNTNTPPRIVELSTRLAVHSIIWKKCLEALQASSLSSIFLNAGKTCLALALSIIITDVQEGIRAVMYVVEWHNWALPKTVAMFALVFGWGYIVRYIEHTLAGVKKDVEGASLYNIPIIKIADLIVETGAFLCIDAQTRLKLSRSQYDTIAKGLEEIMILVRGANNARVLLEGTPREKIIRTLEHASKTGFYHIEEKPAFERTELVRQD